MTTAYATDKTVSSEPTLNMNLELLVTEFVEAKIKSIGADITVENIKTLMDFANNTYMLAECSPTGYFIIHPESGIIYEYSIYDDSPYKDLSENSSVYGGPTYYYEKAENVYTHTIEQYELDTEYVQDITRQCEIQASELITQKNVLANEYFGGMSRTYEIATIDADYTDYWVPSYSWFRNLDSGFGYVSGGICGYIAANLILKYHNYRGTINLPNTSDTTDSTVLTYALYNVAKGLGYSNTSTTGIEVSDTINHYCTSAIGGSASWAIGISGALNELYPGKRPVILFGNMAGAGNHAIVAYGYNEYENTGYPTFICHYGWNYGYSEVHVYGGTSLYGSNCKFVP